MVTSNKLLDKKVVKMADHSSGAVVPQRTLLGEVNEHITCPLCRGYYIDATTIVECLHSFCRSCIIKHLQVKSYCPVCEMMINSAKPNIKLDKALQDIVYKLVPGLFQKEMERRQQFYASRPGPAASATPEQRGEDTERIIFSPEDVISFSLEYADATDTDSISSKSSDSNDPQPMPVSTRRYLQCPAVVNISHLKKFLSVKFDIDSTQCAIGILYKRVPLPDYYTLMDIAYIYNWKRNEPMRFFYQIIDYVAIRNRLFDINRKGSNLRERKSSPASTEDTNVSSPAPNSHDQGSEVSSGANSPMPDESTSKQTNDTLNKNDKQGTITSVKNLENTETLSAKKTDDDVEKSQFLNSFELKAKSNCVPVKSSPSKAIVAEDTLMPADAPMVKIQTSPSKVEEKDKLLDNLKRKSNTLPSTPELKKIKIEVAKANVSDFVNNPSNLTNSTTNQNNCANMLGNFKETPVIPKTSQAGSLSSNTPSNSVNNKECKQPEIPNLKQQVPSNLGVKRNVAGPQNNNSPKRKCPNDTVSPVQLPPVGPKTISPLKLQIPKFESQSSFSASKLIDTQKQANKKIPDLKPSMSMPQMSQNKSSTVNKLRMDLLANNSDPTIDRSKILSQVKTSLSAQSPGPTTGDPLKSLFDSCKINIPSSLSITLTDQKLDRSPTDVANVDPKKGIINKNLAVANNTSTHKVPSPPVHNYIEILKLPDTDPKKQSKGDGSTDTKLNPPNKTDTSTSQTKPVNKSSESSAKGPIPNLKPIADTKLGKQPGNFAAPITFQQTFEQQLQSLQCDKKVKLPKNKTQVPKLVPATPKSLSAAGKLTNSLNKAPNVTPGENKTGTALDLSTPHNIPSPLVSQQTYDKALETMQSIANLAKKQNLPSKSLFPSMTSRPITTGVSPLRIPSTSNMNQLKHEKMNPIVNQNNSRMETPNKSNQIKPTTNVSPTVASPNYIQLASHVSPGPAQPSPRSQTRSPSSSPKLVIAEEKQINNVAIDNSVNQSNQVTSTQVSNVNTLKSESPKDSPGPSKAGPKLVKPLTSNKVTGIWQPLTSTMKSIPPTMNAPSDFISQQLARQLEVNAWIKAQRQYDFMKNMSNMVHQTQHDFNNKDKL